MATMLLAMLCTCICIPLDWLVYVLHAWALFVYYLGFALCICLSLCFFLLYNINWTAFLSPWDVSKCWRWVANTLKHLKGSKSSPVVINKIVKHKPYRHTTVIALAHSWLLSLLLIKICAFSCNSSEIIIQQLLPPFAHTPTPLSMFYRYGLHVHEQVYSHQFQKVMHYTKNEKHIHIHAWVPIRI